MKITIDITKLLEDGKISQEEYQKLLLLSRETTGSLAFNILVGFGVIAVSGGALALFPNPFIALILGALMAAAGLFLSNKSPVQWGTLGVICTLVGSLLFGGSTLMLGEGSVESFIGVTVIFGLAAMTSRSGLLTSLSLLALSSTLGASTEYFHASYFLGIEKPTLTIVVFSGLAIFLYQASKQLAASYERIAVIGARTSIFLVNFGFWIGSLWGDLRRNDPFIGLFAPPRISPLHFSLAWAVVLIATGIWAVKQDRRWVVNTIATFGAIHFYTQWFEKLGASPATVLVAGILAIGIALGITKYNKDKMVHSLSAQ